jgi:15-cis-phytoene synthase
MAFRTVSGNSPVQANPSRNRVPTLAEAQAYCERITKRSGSNFYYSFLFLPRRRREAMYAVYAFCKEVDSAVDDPPAGSDSHEQLRRWRQELLAAYGGAPTLPVTIILAAHIRKLSIPLRYFEDLIAGVEMDLTIRRYPTFEDLSLYCYRVASAVGLICLHVFGTESSAAREYAINLGVAFQLTNILRDLGTDADRGRIYLPQEDLRRFDYSEEDLFKRTYSANFIELMKFECARARQYYHKAGEVVRSLPSGDRRRLTVAEIMRGVYVRILDRIERSNYRVYGLRVGLSPSYRFAIATSVWVRSLFT